MGMNIDIVAYKRFDELSIESWEVSHFRNRDDTRFANKNVSDDGLSE